MSDTLALTTAHGTITIRMRPDLAPKHVARIRELAEQGHYDGLTFHRVIDGFMAQGGCPRGDGTGGTGQNLPDEFSSEPFKRGMVGMAKTAAPNSADSQFFIMLADGDFLNGNYTLWGEVTDGMAQVDAIKKGDARDNGAVEDPDKIFSLRPVD